MKRFAKIVNGWITLTIFAKRSHLDVCHGSKYVSDYIVHSKQFWFFLKIKRNLIQNTIIYIFLHSLSNLPPHEKCPNATYFWSVFFCIQSECRKIRTRNNSLFEHLSVFSSNGEKTPSQVFFCKTFFRTFYLFHGGGPHHIQTSPVIWKVN